MALEVLCMSDEKQQDKQKYESPRMTVISLRPEEAVLGHCKNSTASGPVAPTCNITSCSAIGS
jgi:hypothetical protein